MTSLAGPTHLASDLARAPLRRLVPLIPVFMSISPGWPIARLDQETNHPLVELQLSGIWLVWPCSHLTPLFATHEANSHFYHKFSPGITKPPFRFPPPQLCHSSQRTLLCDGKGLGDDD